MSRPGFGKTVDEVEQARIALVQRVTQAIYDFQKETNGLVPSRLDCTFYRVGIDAEPGYTFVLGSVDVEVSLS